MIQQEPDPSVGEAIRQEIASRITEHQFVTWFNRVDIRFLSSGRITISVPNRFHQTFLEHRYLPIIQDSVETVTNLPQPRIGFEIVEDPRDALVTPPGASEPARPTLGSMESLPDNIPLNADYTFDQFITGPSNRLAHAAAASVGENPGVAYNPLFIYGSVGLGKTHLLQAVAHRFVQQGMTRIVYLSCASFINDFITSLGKNDLVQFRQRYREADALLIDDIQFLGNKERTQEEFFHTFNTIYNQQKQILLTSDSLPSEIAGLGERLVSRFKLGLITQLSPPSFETRIAILIRKGQNLGLDIPPDVAEFVAHRIRDNVREIEGAVMRIHSLVTIERKPLTVEGVRDSLADLLGDEDDRVDVLRIQQSVLEEFDIRPGDLHSKKRTRSIVIPRQICMFLARKHTDMSLGEIGSYFGGRDHSTVLHAIDKIRQGLEQDSKLRQSVAAIERRLGR